MRTPRFARVRSNDKEAALIAPLLRHSNISRVSRFRHYSIRGGTGETSPSARKRQSCATMTGGPMEPSKNEKKSRTQFEPGNTFGKGRPAGSRNKATEALQALLDGEGERITRKAVELALDGDTIALRLCLERLIPPVKERRVSLDVPKLERAGDIATALGTLLDAVATGEITPSEGQTIATLLEVQRKAIETAELEQRITRLERIKNEQTR
jgi:hypothetical protein